MFSDTHCHLSHIRERGEDLSALIGTLAERDYRFVLDIGTKPGDFSARRALVAEAAGGTVPSFIHFSCGLWPDGDVIADRAFCLAALEADIASMLEFAGSCGGIPAAADGRDFSANPGAPVSSSPEAFAALGECGLDRYWNGPAAAERIAATKAATASSGAPVGAASDDGPGTTDIAGEEELFGMQLELAKKNALPVIIHSRDSFDATLGTIRNANYDSGVIHCFSYGIDEARAFLDRGWHISFPGNITWPKKEADRERVARLVRYVPRDRLLLETDAPYLAPVPHRGKTNTPALIAHIYKRAAEILGMDVASLAAIVYENARELFAISR